VLDCCYSGSVLRVDNIGNDRLYLSAGEAHGVHLGDDYAVYPFKMLEDVGSQRDEASVWSELMPFGVLHQTLWESTNQHQL
jgi:hypothetical protein